MKSLRPELAAIVERLLDGTNEGDAIELDAIGEAIAARAVSQEEIDLMLEAIERRKRKISSSGAGGHGEANLKKVLDAARVLRSELQRAPRPGEIAERAGLSFEDVQHALALARVMQR